MNLTKTQRETILTKIQALVAEKYFDPAFDNTAWQAIVNKNRAAILDASSTPAFEAAIGKMLAELSRTSLGLLSDHTPITPRNAINASFSVQQVSGELRWVFQDVLPGGVAARADVRPGDLLLIAAGKSIYPTAQDSPEPLFEMHQNISIVVSRGTPPKENLAHSRNAHTQVQRQPIFRTKRTHRRLTSGRCRIPEGQSFPWKNRN